LYKWDARDYSRNSSSQQEWARELIGKLQLRGNERVLDIGCGDGKVSAEIAGWVPQGSVVGLDISREMIDYARQNFPSDTHSNLEFVLGDASNLNYVQEFDVVFSNAALQWIIDHIPVIKGIARSLKPSGKVLLQMGGKGNAALILALANHKCGNGKWSVYFKDFKIPYGFYSPGEYAGWLQQVGLTTNRVELIPKDMVHRSKDDLAAWVRTTWIPYTHRIPAAMQDNYIEEIIDEYLGICPPDQNGCTHVQMYRLEVEATK
jgi:trans-aconitate methyltransferase